MLLYNFKTNLKRLYKTSTIVLNNQNNSIYIGKIEIDNSLRNKGIGTEIMQKICKFADDNNVPIYLIPSSDFGSNIDRLINFYYRFGFTFFEDYTMCRKPLIKS